VVCLITISYWLNGTN